MLCELYLHEVACPMNIQFNPISHIGDVHLRAFTSFFTNQMLWWNASLTIQKNEEKSTLWIRGEPQSYVAIIEKHQKFLYSPSKVDQLAGLQEDAINICMQLIKRQEPYAL